jgi:hypothetical protein
MGFKMLNQFLGWFLSFGPTGLAIEFVVVVALVSTGMWLVCSNWSSVFWKRTDYAYFLLTILGGAVGAADLAVSNWTKELQQIQLASLSNMVDLRGYVSAAISQAICRSKTTALLM